MAEPGSIPANATFSSFCLLSRRMILERNPSNLKHSLGNSKSDGTCFFNNKDEQNCLDTTRDFSRK